MQSWLLLSSPTWSKSHTYLYCLTYVVNRALTSINLLGNNIGTDQANTLIEILEGSDKHTTMCGFTGTETELNVSKKGLSASCAMLVANEIKVNRALTSVNLSDNYLQAEGAKVVAEVLPQCKYVV